MHPGPARIIVTFSTGLALAGALGACGSESPPPQPPGAHHVAEPVRVDPRADAAPLLADVIKRIDEQGSARSTVQGRLGLVGDLNSDGTVRYRDGQADVALGGHTQTSKTEPPQEVELSIINGVGYLKSPLLLPEPGKPWLRVTRDGHDFGAQLLGPALEQLRDAADPRGAFAGVEHATKIQSSAPEDLDGRPTTRYELRVLTARAAQASPDPDRRAQLRKAADTGRAELGYQLWIDESGLPVRFAATQNVAQAGQVSLTSTYRDWGVHTDILPPPAELVGVYRAVPAPQAQPPR
jgi:hypothetical protein